MLARRHSILRNPAATPIRALPPKAPRSNRARLREMPAPLPSVKRILTRIRVQGVCARRLSPPAAKVRAYADRGSHITCEAGHGRNGWSREHNGLQNRASAHYTPRSRQVFAVWPVAYSPGFLTARFGITRTMEPVRRIRPSVEVFDQHQIGASALLDCKQERLAVW